MKDKQRIQHDYLLADFRFVKAEIARRSNTQKAALAAIVGFYAWLLNQIVSSDLGLWHVGAVWIVTILGSAFHKREDMEIRRLGGLIKVSIAEVAAKKLEVPAEKLIPSEFRGADGTYDRNTKLLNCLFSVSLFGFIPVALTVTYIVNTYCE